MFLPSTCTHFGSCILHASVKVLTFHLQVLSFLLSPRFVLFPVCRCFSRVELIPFPLFAGTLPFPFSVCMTHPNASSWEERTRFILLVHGWKQPGGDGATAPSPASSSISVAPGALSRRPQFLFTHLHLSFYSLAYIALSRCASSSPTFTSSIWLQPLFLYIIMFAPVLGSSSGISHRPAIVNYFRGHAFPCTQHSFAALYYFAAISSIL